MRNAFISRSTFDDRYVAEMESFLRAAGFDEVFNDVSAIRHDEKFWPEIEKGIAKCEALVITFASSGLEWVKREVEYARGLSKKIIPVWIEDCPIPPMFADRDVIDFRPRTRQERRFEISRIDVHLLKTLGVRATAQEFATLVYQSECRKRRRISLTQFNEGPGPAKVACN